MKYQLLVALKVVLLLQSLPKRKRLELMAHFRSLERSPDRYADYQEYERHARPCEVSVYAGFAISYWIDFPDRHIKILSLDPAD